VIWVREIGVLAIGADNFTPAGRVSIGTTPDSGKELIHRLNRR